MRDGPAAGLELVDAILVKVDPKKLSEKF